MTDPMDVDQNDSSYDQVQHKKLGGSITLSSEQLRFHNNQGTTNITVPWTSVVKHQVSPVTYPKSLLKLVLKDNSNLTFQLPDRSELERIRNDITTRLQHTRAASNSDATASSKKRTFAQLRQGNSTSFEDLDPTVLAVTRSSLLAANPALRKQHSHLVKDTETLTEEDFWETHRALLEEEHARISGMSKAGASSFFASHLPSSGRITLGVEEMRQIFILYPAVHKAYEDKVPLELSEEQFWRRYLESEYFHRDRGRIGETARNHAGPVSANNQSSNNKKQSGPSIEEQEARAAVVGTDDLFSRYDQKLKEKQSNDAVGELDRRSKGRQLACGQFDLASTFESERGHLLQGPKDNFPPNQADDGKGSRVIQKYNRHWAMVLHPDDAVAGSDLHMVARRSVTEVLPGDDDPNAGGGLHKEMKRLVEFASAREQDADHAAGIGNHGEYEPLTLKNVEAYYSGVKEKTPGETSTSEEDAAKRHVVFAKAIASKAETLLRSFEKNNSLPSGCFPPAALGRELLSALTKKMAQDAKTESASLEVINNLPEDFRNNLRSYFRRSSELLRHFYGLRRLDTQQHSDIQKLSRIVRGMETFYREMETMRKQLPQTETGETMRKMCLPIMDQLDWAFKLHREGSGGGGGGGFVTVDEM